MNSQTRRRILWGAVIGAVLMIFVIGMLTFADSYAPDEALRCTARFIQSKWPAYLGCAMAKHEGFAAGLIGGAGALFGAWLAFDAVQEQILAERNLRIAQQIEVIKQQEEAKPAAVLCIADSVQAASVLLYGVNLALASDTPKHRQYDERVDIGILRLKHCIENFIVRESLSNLGVKDRRDYLLVIRILFGCVNASAIETRIGDRTVYLTNMQKILMQLHWQLNEFDGDLASEFAWDSQTSPPQKIHNAYSWMG